MNLHDDPAVLSQPMTVRCYEQDPRGRLRPGEVFNWFQEAACGQCRRHGAAIEDLQPRGYTWVIHRYKVVVHSMPAYGDECRVSTWAHPKRDLISVRDFALDSASGQSLVSATSQWALIDLKSQRPIRLSAALKDFPAREARALDEELKPINIPAGLAITGEHEVTVSAWCLDQNHHVNNSVYIFWTYDSLYPLIKETPVLREVEVNYKRQAFHGQAVVCQSYAAPGGTYYTDIKLKESGETLALVHSAWSA